MTLVALALKRWLIAALALPIIVWLLRRFADSRGDDSFLARRLRGLARRLSRHESGPLAHDRDDGRDAR
jgi:hypothetical protein